MRNRCLPLLSSSSPTNPQRKKPPKSLKVRKTKMHSLKQQRPPAAQAPALPSTRQLTVREAGSLVKSGAHRALDLLAPVVAPDVKAGGRTRRVTQNRLMAAGYALSLAGLAFRGAKAHLLFGALFTVLLGVHLYQHRRVL